MTVAKNFPRLLVATEFPPNGSGGGASVVRQMLKEWPTDRLYWWSYFPDRDQRFSQRVAAHRVATVPPRLYPNRRWRHPKAWFIEHFWCPWAAGHFRKTLALFDPDAVWVIPSCWSIPPLAKVLPSANVGFHVTVQDYPDCNDWVRQFGYARTRRLAVLADQLYAKATTRDATSHPMIADLRARTGAGAAQMLHAGLEPDDFNFLRARAAVPDGPIRIAFAGSISREDNFGCFIRALDALRAALPKPLSFELFSSHSYSDRPWFDPTWMHERGNLPEPDFNRALRECTWGFAMMSLAEDDRCHRLSFPTKFISYLAAGLPIFTLGHPETSVVKMAQQYRVGICLTSGDLETLKTGLLPALMLADPWKTFGPEILRCARDEFDAVRRRQTLYECFRICARQRGWTDDTSASVAAGLRLNP